MQFPSDLLYARTHEWVRITGNTARIGLSDFAQDALGDLVFVNLPQVGDAVEAGSAVADVESVKTVSDVFSPVSGTVSAVNDALTDAPELINQAPYETWLVEITGVSSKGDLMTAAEYEALCQEEA